MRRLLRGGIYSTLPQGHLRLQWKTLTAEFRVVSSWSAECDEYWIYTLNYKFVMAIATPSLSCLAAFSCYLLFGPRTDWFTHSFNLEFWIRSPNFIVFGTKVVCEFTTKIWRQGEVDWAQGENVQFSTPFIVHVDRFQVKRKKLPL